MDKQLADHQLEEEKRLLNIEQNIKSLEVKLDILQKDISDLVSAWKAASWLVSAVKWASATVVAITALYTLMKGH